MEKHWCDKLDATQPGPKETCEVCQGAVDAEAIEKLRARLRSAVNRPRQNHEKGVRFV